MHQDTCAMFHVLITFNPNYFIIPIYDEETETFTLKCLPGFQDLVDSIM